jgi:glycosyltransferase involved in cell wall biosynthesis
MTTYNGERYLPKQLETIALQSRLPDEIVICDDRSTDATHDIIKEFAASAPFDVRMVFNATNLGHERNFSQAISLARGDVIFLADQDDAWYPDKLSVVEQAFHDDPQALLFVNDALITNENLDSTGRTVLGQMRAAGVLGPSAKSLTLGCATAIRSRLLDLVSPIPHLNYGHDSWIHDFTEVLGGRRVLHRVLQLYRRHGHNASTWAFSSRSRASPIVVMRPSAGKDLTSEYEKRLCAITLMRARIVALGPDAFEEIRSGRDYESIISDLASAITAVETRKDMFRRGWLGRKRLAAAMLTKGQYRHFLGWRSFAKDMIR